MRIKDISRGRLEEIAAALIDRVYEGEKIGGWEFEDVLARDGISLAEAEAFGFEFDGEARAKYAEAQALF